MRIGVDACCWSNSRGYGRFTRELLKVLVPKDSENEYFFFVDKDTASDSLKEFPQGSRPVIAPTRVSPTAAASARGRRSVRDLLVMSRQVMKHDLDLFFFPANYTYFPVFNRVRILLGIHDMTPDRYPEAVFPDRKLRFFWQVKQYLALRQARLIVTVSEYSKKEIMKYARVPESSIRVVTEGPNRAFRVREEDVVEKHIHERFGMKTGERFLLYVGGISPHKNLGTLIEAYSRLTSDPDFFDVKLVLAGDYQGDSFYSAYPALKREVGKRGLEGKVVFTGYVDDDTLACLYNAAAMFVFPSLQEGFGLPAVEAMACGTPVAASTAGSLPEILGDAGRFFDPEDAGEMTAVIRGILADNRLAEDMKARGLERAKNFTWEKSAEGMLSVFSELAGH